MTAICPKCDKKIASLRAEKFSAATDYSGRNTLKAVILKCPSCHTILGVQLDPTAVAKIHALAP